MSSNEWELFTKIVHYDQNVDAFKKKKLLISKRYFLSFTSRYFHHTDAVKVYMCKRASLHRHRSFTYSTRWVSVLFDSWLSINKMCPHSTRYIRNAVCWFAEFGRAFFRCFFLISFYFVWLSVIFINTFNRYIYIQFSWITSIDTTWIVKRNTFAIKMSLEKYPMKILKRSMTNIAPFFGIVQTFSPSLDISIAFQSSFALHFIY